MSIHALTHHINTPLKPTSPSTTLFCTTPMSMLHAPCKERSKGHVRAGGLQCTHCLGRPRTDSLKRSVISITSYSTRYCARPPFLAPPSRTPFSHPLLVPSSSYPLSRTPFLVLPLPRTTPFLVLLIYTRHISIYSRETLMNIHPVEYHPSISRWRCCYSTSQ